MEHKKLTLKELIDAKISDQGAAKAASNPFDEQQDADYDSSEMVETQPTTLFHEETDEYPDRFLTRHLCKANLMSGCICASGLILLAIVGLYVFLSLIISFL